MSKNNPTGLRPARGHCARLQVVYGVVRVSDKGQVAIPTDLRRELGIERGDRLLVLRRRDGAGLSLIRVERMGELWHRLQEDDALLAGREKR